ncbi:hypothetical protein LZP69_00610 [Shewanella sp. AS1]|uniref:hypothetical protein n=1 Tax=Shewanella sp. AS1 TaxID=2907626 RepID=UPI001F472CB3|nr:hypothetical protein [Shewanella sp. AS1]MCE9677690.1 hypothetical protein [Shewanella sp. AS1]
MLDAIYRDDNSKITYSVFRFQSLDEAQIERLRQQLYCPACDGKAYYRKASRDGKAACFGSRYHSADCPEFKPSLSRQREEQDAIEVNQMLQDSESLVIDFSKPPRRRAGSQGKAPTSKPASQAKKAADLVAEPETNYGVKSAGANKTDSESSQANTAQESGAGEQNTQPKMGSEGLEKLLNSLLRGSDLAKSDLWVYTDPKYRWRAKNLFVNFSDAEPTEKGAPRMYWGTISHSDKAMMWLNPADCQDVGIPIDLFKPELCQRFGIQSRRDLEGAGIIIFGKCFYNKDKTRKIIQLWNRDISRMHLSLPEEA